MEQIFFFIHEPDKGLGPALARYMIRKLNERLPDLALKEPILLDESQGELF